MPVRIAYFKMNTDVRSLLVHPIWLGFVIAILRPYLNLVGAYIAQFADLQLKKIQDQNASIRRIAGHKLRAEEFAAEAELQKQKEMALIASEERLRKAAEIGGQGLVYKIKNARGANRYLDLDDNLSESQKELFRLIYSTSNGGNFHQDPFVPTQLRNNEVILDPKFAGKVNEILGTTEKGQSLEGFKSAIITFINNELLQEVDSDAIRGKTFRFTELGQQYGRHLTTMKQ